MTNLPNWAYSRGVWGEFKRTSTWVLTGCLTSSATINGHLWIIYVEEKSDETFNVMISKDRGVIESWDFRTEREVDAFFAGLHCFEKIVNS